MNQTLWLMVIKVGGKVVSSDYNVKFFDEISLQNHYFFHVIPVLLLLNVQMHISVLHFLKAMGAGKPGTLKVQLQNLI